jgi:hypothetical protein
MALTNELVEASGQYGLRADKLGGATTLLSLLAVRRRVDRDGVSAEEAALDVVREAVDAWRDQRGRLILRSALGFDRGTVRGRTTRLDHLATDLNADLDEHEPRKKRVHDTLLDEIFTSRLAPDLAATLLAVERRSRRSRKPLVLAGAILLLLAAVLVAFLLLRPDGDDDAAGLVFEPIPQRCSIDVCNSEPAAIEARTAGFALGGIVDVVIIAPNGQDANDLGGAYAYNAELVVDDNGSFTWRYWWDAGMAPGIYRVRITDRETGKVTEATFELF